MANLLQRAGYREAERESDADVILLNTCSVRAKPEQKVMSKLGELRLLKSEKPGLVVGVCGCMAQRNCTNLLKRAKWVDFVVGTAAIGDLPSLIGKARSGAGQLASVDLPDAAPRLQARTQRIIGNVRLREFVPVMYGCDNFCAYCVVPSARGPERSRPADEIVSEIEQLVALGCREVTLVGQNVNSYAGTMTGGLDAEADRRVDFALLLGMLNDIKGLERIRFTTSHPKDLSDSLIEAIGSLPKVCEHLHLPLQSGDDVVLRRMARRYTVASYTVLVEKARVRVPEIALTTDLMVGFPGETDEQFRNTLAAVEAVRYDGAFMFSFNPRPGTVAAKMDAQIDEAVKLRRLRELIELQDSITLERNQSLVGEVFEILVDGISGKNPSNMTGLTRTHKTVNFPATDDLTGRLVQVRAVAAHPWGFTGELQR